MFKLRQRVRILKDVPEENVTKGDIGRVAYIAAENLLLPPHELYAVQFTNTKGKITGLVIDQEDAFEAYSNPPPPPPHILQLIWVRTSLANWYLIPTNENKRSRHNKPTSVVGRICLDIPRDDIRGGRWAGSTLLFKLTSFVAAPMGGTFTEEEPRHPPVNALAYVNATVLKWFEQFGILTEIDSSSVTDEIANWQKADGDWYHKDFLPKA